MIPNDIKESNPEIAKALEENKVSFHRFHRIVGGSYADLRDALSKPLDEDTTYQCVEIIRHEGSHKGWGTDDLYMWRIAVKKMLIGPYESSLTIRIPYSMRWKLEDLARENGFSLNVNGYIVSLLDEAITKRGDDPA